MNTYASSKSKIRTDLNQGRMKRDAQMVTPLPLTPPLRGLFEININSLKRQLHDIIYFNFLTVFELLCIDVESEK